VYIPFDPTNPVLRLTVQIDFTAPSVTAWVNGTEATMVTAAINAGWVAGLAFADNPGYPLNVGSVSQNALSNNFGPTMDMTIAGLKICSGLRYTSASSQTPVSGTLNDAYRYANSASPSGDICVLQRVTDAVGDPVVLRCLVPASSGLTGELNYGLFVSETLTNWDTPGYNGIRDVDILVPNTTGHCVSTGFVYNFTVDGSGLEGGGVGLGTLFFGANYPITVRQSLFQYNHDSAHISYYAAATHFTDVSFKGWVRSTVRGFLSQVFLDNVLATYSNSCIDVLYLVGTSGSFNNWVVDFEGAPAPSRSYVYVSPGGNVGPNNLSFRHFNVGTIPAGGDYVYVDSRKFNAGIPCSEFGIAPGFIIVENSLNSFISAGASSLFALDSTLYQGKITGITPPIVPLARNWKDPAIPVRIGLDSTPPASVPPPGSRATVLSLPGLRLWWDIQSLGLSDGASVTSLTDSSGNGVVTTQSGSPPATYANSAYNGLACMRVGNSCKYSPSLTSTSGAMTWYFTVRFLDLNWGSSGLFLMSQTTGLFLSAWSRGVSTGTLAAPLHMVNAPTPASTQIMVLVARVTAASPNQVLSTWVNGSKYGEYQMPSTAGVFYNGSSLGYTGGQGCICDLVESIACDSAHDDGTVQAVSFYMMSRAGVTY